MFSLDKFYYILHKNLFEYKDVNSLYFYPFGSVDPEQISGLGFNNVFDDLSNNNFKKYTVWYYDQEPLYQHVVDACVARHEILKQSNHRQIILANSEHSELKNQICKENGYVDWYYFFHGFAALDWYRAYQYVPFVENQFTKVFISLNRLVTQDRSYRLNLVANLLEHDLVKHGLVSLQLEDHSGTVKSEVFNTDSKLSVAAKKLIYTHIMPLTEPLVVDELQPQGFFSAEPDLELQHQALWNVVTETIFYQNKLHLTEKIFKPIVARRPFILVGAVNNLAYLKSYGFKTFDKWIDESYDTIEDPDLRIKAVTEELAKLCALEPIELLMMYEDMKETLEYNFNHFYGEFKHIIVKEMLDNAPDCIKFDYDMVLKRLTQ